MKCKEILYNLCKGVLIYLMCAMLLVTKTSAQSQSCATVTLQSVTVGTNLFRYGYEEFTNSSGPPKVYLQETAADWRSYMAIYSDISSDEFGDPILSYVDNADSYKTVTVSSISPTNGAISTISSGSCSYSDFNSEVDDYANVGGPPYYYNFFQQASASLNSQGVWSDGGTVAYELVNSVLGNAGADPLSDAGNQPPLNVTNIANSVTPTSSVSSWSYQPDSDLYQDSDADVMIDFDEATYGLTLATQNSDQKLHDSLVSLLPGYSANWNGSAIAGYSYTNANCLYATGTNMEYRFALSGWTPKETYRVSWVETTTKVTVNGGVSMTSSVPQNRQLDITPTGDPTQPYYTAATPVMMPVISWPTLSKTIAEVNPGPPVIISPGTAGGN